MKNDYGFEINAMVLAIFWLCTLVLLQTTAINLQLPTNGTYENFWLMMNLPIFFAAAASGIAAFAKEKNYIR